MSTDKLTEKLANERASLEEANVRRNSVRIEMQYFDLRIKEIEASIAELTEQLSKQEGDDA